MSNIIAQMSPGTLTIVVVIDRMNMFDGETLEQEVTGCGTTTSGRSNPILCHHQWVVRTLSSEPRLANNTRTLEPIALNPGH
jgi:hypothetical protein